jgi:DNA polymerase III alpha subunit
MRQRPGSASGIVFLTVENEHGIGNLVVFPDVVARDRAALMAGRLLIAEGRVEREMEHVEVPITYLIVCRPRPLRSAGQPRRHGRRRSWQRLGRAGAGTCR